MIRLGIIGAGRIGRGGVVDGGGRGVVLEREKNYDKVKRA